MSHFAYINSKGIVEKVIVAEQDVIDSGFFGNPLRWIQTSYNTIGGVHKLNGIPLRKNFAGIGFFYNPILDAFIPPKPYNSWILNEDTCLWESPKPYPNDDKKYVWNEKQLNWIEVA